MPESPKVKGPASYFPPIAKTYGRPISHWLEILQKAGPLKHMELVSLLTLFTRARYICDVT